MKIRPVGAEFFHADGQTDMSKQIVAFPNFAKAPKEGILRKTANILAHFIYIKISM